MVPVLPRTKHKQYALFIKYLNSESEFTAAVSDNVATDTDLSISLLKLFFFNFSKFHVFTDSHFLIESVILIILLFLVSFVNNNDVAFNFMFDFILFIGSIPSFHSTVFILLYTKAIIDDVLKVKLFIAIKNVTAYFFNGRRMEYLFTVSL